MLRKLLLFLFYSLFAVLVTVVLLVVRFPREAVIEYLRARVERELPGYRCGLTGITYQYPYGLSVGRVTLTGSGNLPDLILEDLLLTVDPTSPLEHFNVGFTALGGVVLSDIYLRQQGSIVECTNLSVSGIELKQVEMMVPLNRRLSGRIDFDGCFTARRMALDQGELSGMVTVRGLRASLKRPVLATSEVRFDRVETRIRYQERLITVDNGIAEGPLCKGAFSGAVTIVPGWSGATIDLGGIVIPEPGYIRKNKAAARAAALLYKKYKSTRLPYRVSGTLREPVFRFGLQ